MSKKITVAAIQMNCVLYDKERNLEHAEELIEAAVARGAKLIVLPELFSTGYRSEERDRELAEPLDGQTIKRLQSISRKHDVYLAGAILESADDLVFDTAVLVGAEGLLGRHRKMHLWSGEEKRFARGEEIGVVKLPFATVGMLICYEIGFPEMSRIQVLKGADILIYPSAFGRARYYVWDAASKARALENGAFVVACNRCGQDKDTSLGGLSRIVSPDTTLLASASADGEAIVCAEIDLDRTKEMRETLPYLRDLNPRLINKNF